VAYGGDERRFDYVIAVGFFDYVGEPLPFLRRAREVTRVERCGKTYFVTGTPGNRGA